MPHEPQTLDDNLTQPILDVLRETLEGLVIEGADADGLGNIFDVVGIPEQLGLVGWLGRGRGHNGGCGRQNFVGSVFRVRAVFVGCLLEISHW